MDILKPSSFQPFNLKRFTVNATASAILALNTEAASAVTCPAQITDPSLAGVICDFTSGSTVTVENGGQVGGITMNAYNPLASQIRIETGGIISNSSATGISIVNSSLTNGLVNNGTINVNGIGISIDSNNVISGGIFNNGTIASASSTGIRVVNSNIINGDISNNGTISAGSVNDGIVVGFNNIISGDITNTGLIQTGNNGNGIVIFLTNTILGSIINTGTINSGRTGVLVYINSTIDGNMINSGAIVAGTNGMRISNVSRVEGNIINSGVINAGDIGLAINSASIVSGISNSGIISAGHTGIAVTSTSTISGAISNSGTIQGDTHAIYVDPASNVSNINIVGQSAKIIGSVDAINTNFNITSDAIFTSNGTFNVNSFNIAPQALFTMANSITAQDVVTNAGTLAIGNTTQSITSTNGYVQSAGGRLQLGVTSTKSYGQLAVNNTVDLSQSGNINVQVAQNASLHAGDTFTNVISGSTLITPTNGFQVTDNSFIWAFTANANNTGVDLTATINPTVYNICQGDYCQGAAAAIIGQIAAGNPLFSPYASLTTASQFQVAASQATPELTNENIQVTQLMARSVMDVVPMWSRLQGKSAGDAMVSQPGKIWLKPYAASMIQDESNTIEGFNATAYGIVLGKEVQFSDETLLGGAFAIGKDNLHGKALLSGQSISSNVYQGILCGAKKFPHHLYLAGQGLIGLQKNETSRSIPLYASTAQASFNSWFANIRAQLGWNLYVLNPDLVLTPALDASYLFINQNSYRESGSPMDLSVASNNNSSLVLGAYGHGAYRLTTLTNQQDLTFTAYAGIARDVLNSKPQTTATFLAGGPSFTTVGIQFNRLVFRGGVGLTLENPVKPLKMNLNYDFQTGNNAYSGIGSVTVIYKL